MLDQFIATGHARDAMRGQFEPKQPERPPRRPVLRPFLATALHALADRLEPAGERVPDIRRA